MLESLLSVDPVGPVSAYLQVEVVVLTFEYDVEYAMKVKESEN